MIENGWGDPFTTPPQTIPGPSNPWLSCLGGGAGGGSQKPTVPLPQFPIGDEAGMFQPPYDKVIGGLGIIIMIQGISLVSLGVAAGIAAAAGSAPFWGLVGVAVFAITVGALAIGFGAAALLAAIDPPVLDHTLRVVPPPRRPLAIPADLSPEMVQTLTCMVEMERLTIGEKDLLDRARAAASAKDVKSYEMHMGDLFVVQDRRQHFGGKLADALRAFVKSNGPLLDKLKLPASAPVRDIVNPATHFRREVEAVGLSPTEFNSALGMMTLPSPALDAAEKGFRDRLSKSKTASDLVHHLIDDLDGAVWINWDAYGGKPT